MASSIKMAMSKTEKYLETNGAYLLAAPQEVKTMHKGNFGNSNLEVLALELGSMGIKVKKTGLPPFSLNKKFGEVCKAIIEVSTIRRGIFLILTAWVLTLFLHGSAAAQEKKQMVRLSKLEIDAAQLESYKAALKEEIETSIRVEPGVLTLYAVSEKDNPTRITILEIYADEDAYKSHIKTPHFLKYKTGTLKMVKSLELIETVPIAPGTKVKAQ